MGCIWGTGALAVLLATAATPGVAAGQAAAAGEGRGGIGAAVDREMRSLTAQDYAQRQEALQRLEALIAQQVGQRAKVQEILDLLQKDLAQQLQALALVTDEEARARIAGLLELERGLAGWTIRTLGETPERRRELLEWGLGSSEAASVLARAYGASRRGRVEGAALLAKMEAQGAAWTLGQMINDPDGAVRAAAMAAAWKAKAQPEIVQALWHRAVSGPLVLAERGGVTPLTRVGDRPDEAGWLKVTFPEGEPMEFVVEDDAGEYTDAILAGIVLVQLKSPLVAERTREMVKQRAQGGKTLVLEEDTDWTLVMNWLVETYAIKEAIPLLAEAALSANSEQLMGNTNGRSFMFTPRTISIGVLCKLIGKEPGDFGLIRGRDTGELRGWMWAVDINPQAAFAPNAGPADGAAVRAFYAWWKDHYAEYGVKEAPSASGVPPEPRGGGGRRGGRGRGAVEPEIDPAQEMPLDIQNAPAGGRG